jgi:Fe-S-cluster containining protein
MKITDLLYSVSMDSQYPVTKEYILKQLKLIGNIQLDTMRFTSGEEMTQEYHQEIDQLITEDILGDQDVKDTIRCKGCSACCHSAVTITDLEAQLLLSYCKKNNIDLNVELMEKQAEKGLDNWLELDLESRKCMFLNEEGSCTVYDARPGVCRKHLVISDPVKCGVIGGLKVSDRIFNLNMELLVSSMWQIRKIGNMAKMVKNALT